MYMSAAYARFVIVYVFVIASLPNTKLWGRCVPWFTFRNNSSEHVRCLCQFVRGINLVSYCAHFCNCKSTVYETVGKFCVVGSRFVIIHERTFLCLCTYVICARLLLQHVCCLRTITLWYYLVFVHVMLLLCYLLFVHVSLFEHVMLFWCAVLCEHVYTVFAFLFSFCWLIFE